MRRCLDREAPRAAQFELAAGELDVGAAGGHPDDFLVGHGADFALAGGDVHVLLGIDDGIVMLALQ